MYTIDMSFLYTPRPFNSQDKYDAVVEILDRTTPDRDFYVLVIGGVLLAVAGIFLDSIAVLIASMIIAPLASPILGLSLGLVSKDWRLSVRSVGMLILSFLIGLLGAWVLTLCFGHFRVDREFISFQSNLTIATIIAIISGAIAAYGLVRSKVGGSAVGISIAVSLMPPLVATGIGLADPGSLDISITFAIFALNVIGILAGSAMVFMALGIHSAKRSL